jgi:hypothetical protein
MYKYTMAVLGIGLFFSQAVIAQESTGAEEKSDIFDTLLDTLGDAAKDVMQDKVDEFAGTYSGRLDEVRLVERLGNSIVLDVTYKDIKASDGVNVHAEVLSGGAPLEGFSTLLTPVSGREGQVRLTIKKKAVDDGWGLSSTELESDQIRLFLVRETHPDRSFGQIVYDLPKTWSDSSEPDEAPVMVEDDGAIELAEGESLENGGRGTATQTGPYYPAGVVLAPATVKAPASTQPSAQVTGQAQQPVQMAKPVQALATIQSYSFYTEANARRANWRGTGGALAVNGTFHDRTGSVRTIGSGRLSTNNAIKDLLLIDLPRNTQKNGYIIGRYPTMRLAPGLHFKAIAGYIKGAKARNGATFIVNVIDVQQRTRKQVIKRKVAANEYARLDANLSQWAGKQIRIELHVDSNGNKTPDRAVWVKPRISQ